VLVGRTAHAQRELAASAATRLGVTATATYPAAHLGVVEVVHTGTALKTERKKERKKIAERGFRSLLCVHFPLVALRRPRESERERTRKRERERERKHLHTVESARVCAWAVRRNAHSFDASVSNAGACGQNLSSHFPFETRKFRRV
jgi:hypothetical protein